MDLEEDTTESYENIANTNLTLVIKIIYSILLVIYLIPNSVLIKKLSNYEFYQFNFYYIIVHLCWANILQMIYSVYIVFVPEELTSTHVSVFGVFFYLVTPSSAQLALFFTIDKFVNSKKFCRDNIRMSYKSLGFALILVSILAQHDIAHIFTLAIVFVVIQSLLVLVLIIRLIIYCVNGSEEENYCQRLIMAIICIGTNYLYVIYVVLNVLLKLNVRDIYFYVTIVVHMNGMINMAILHFYDPNVNIDAMVSENLENQKNQFRNFKNKFRKKSPNTEEGTTQPISRYSVTSV